MRVLYALVVASLLAVPVSAQVLTIHPHPTTDQATYTSPAAWPVDSAQCHWRPGNANPLPMTPVVDDPRMPVFDPQISHTHLDCNLPRYAELGGPIPVTCTIKLFHTAGHVGGLFSPMEQIRDVVWRDTGTATPPIMQGDPMDVRQWVVDLIFDPTLVRHTFPPTLTTPHGWYTGIISVRTEFTNGDFITTDTVRSLYSVIDPTQPESKTSDEGIINATRCAPNTLRRPELNHFGNQMGVVVSEFSGAIPIAPIAAPWLTEGFFYSYAALEGITGFAFPNGTFQQRVGVDIHAGVAGTTVATQVVDNVNGLKKTPMTIDPAVMGPGKKNLVAFWRQPDGQGNDVTALYVIQVTVGPGVPPPTLCTDPRATNVGGPLPCVFPPPPTLCTDPLATNVGMPLPCVFPVPVTWATFPATFQRFGTQDRYRICDAAGHCVELAVKP